MKTFSEILRNDEALKVKKIKYLILLEKLLLRVKMGQLYPYMSPKSCCIVLGIHLRIFFKKTLQDEDTYVNKSGKSEYLEKIYFHKIGYFHP